MARTTCLPPCLQVLTYGIATAAILRMVLIVAGVDIGEAAGVVHMICSARWMGMFDASYRTSCIAHSMLHPQVFIANACLCALHLAPLALQWSALSRSCWCLPPSCLSPASSC